MSNAHTIAELREAKLALEKNLMRTLEEFERRYDVRVNEVRLSRLYGEHEIMSPPMVTVEIKL